MKLPQSHINIVGYKVPVEWGLLVLSLVITAVVCMPSIYNGWVNWDDPYYVLNNSLVKSLSWDNIKLIFSEQVHGNYHPITVFSLAIDYWAGSDNPFVYHVHNLVLHIINTALVFFFFLKFSKKGIIAFIVSLLFGIHPMHIEPVAWVSSRKDLLLGFYFILGLISWVYYQKSGCKNRMLYYLTILSFILALLSKAVAVVFPVVLFLFDYISNRKVSMKMILEKTPFLLISLLLGLFATKIQYELGATSNVTSYSFIEATLVACNGALFYVVQAIAPFHLSSFHPYPELVDGRPWFFYVSFFIVVVSVVIIIVKGRKNKPLIFGTFFFLLVVSPVLQFIPVGSAMIAERYTYLPYLGLFYLMAVGFNWVIEQKKFPVKLSLGIGMVYCLFLSYISFERIQVWENSETLWNDVIEKYPNDFFGYSNRGSYYSLQNQIPLAEKDLNKSISLNPKSPGTYNNLGLIYMRNQESELALINFDKAINLDEKDFKYYMNRGIVYRETRRIDESLESLSQAIKLNPLNGMSFIERGTTYMFAQDYLKAISDFSEAIKLSVDRSSFYYYRADAYCYNNQFEEGILDFSEAIKLDGNNAKAYFGRSRAYLAVNNKTLAFQDYIKAKDLGYSMPDEYQNVFK